MAIIPDTIDFNITHVDHFGHFGSVLTKSSKGGQSPDPHWSISWIPTPDDGPDWTPVLITLFGHLIGLSGSVHVCTHLLSHARNEGSVQGIL